MFAVLQDAMLCLLLHCSFVVEGIVQFLLSEEADAVALLEFFEFQVSASAMHARRCLDIVPTLFCAAVVQIVPMVNTDGVVNGNYTNGLTGFDYNTVWDDPDAHKHPEVYYLKEHMRQLQAESRIVAYIDVHAHSSKPGVFLYGCSGDRAGFDRAKCVHIGGSRELCGCTKFGPDDSLLGHDPHALANSLGKFVPAFSKESCQYVHLLWWWLM